MTSLRPLESPLIEGRYRRVRLAGRGAFGRVLEVVDTQTDQRRALKIVPAGPDEALLLAEFAQLSRLAHPSLPRVFDVGRLHDPVEGLAAGSPYFVADWIAGTSLESSVTGRPTAAAVWALLSDLASALAALHEVGIVHADVAPQNVIVAVPAPPSGGAEARGQAASLTGDRAVLVDLGLAGAASSTIDALDTRGTPTYMAPEAFVGVIDRRADLYGLGAVALRFATGVAPYTAASTGALVHAIVTGTGRAPLPTTLPGPLVDLISRLLAHDPDDRPASASAVLSELADLRPLLDVPHDRPRGAARIHDLRPASAAAAPKVAAVASPMSREVSQLPAAPPATAWPGADAWSARLEIALVKHRVVVVAGAEAAGARALIEVWLRRRQLAAVARGERPAPVRAGPPGSFVAIATDAGSPPPPRRFIDQLAHMLAASAAPQVVELAGDPRAQELLLALHLALQQAAATAGTAPAIVVLVDAATLVPPGLEAIAVPTFDAAALGLLVSGWLGRTPSTGWLEALEEAAHAYAPIAIEIVEALGRHGDPLAGDPRSFHSGGAVGATALAVRLLEACSPGARSLATLVAIRGGTLELAMLLAPAAARLGVTFDVLAAATELERARLARRAGSLLAIDHATASAAERLLGPAACAHHAATLLDVVDPVASDGELGVPTEAANAEAVAPLYERFEVADASAGRVARAALTCERLLACGRADRAFAIGTHLVAGLGRASPPHPGLAGAGLIAARAAATLARYPEAIELARAAGTAGADAAEVALIIARAAQRGGDLGTAEAVLAKLHEQHPEHLEVAGAYARLLVTRARYADARRVATTSPAPLTALRAEAAGLAAFYLGDLDAADVAFAALEAGATTTGATAAIARALSLRGMVAQQRGRLALASDRYREAAAKFAELGEVHPAAVSELNLGTVLTERGRASEALPRLVAAGRVFAGLGATTETIAAELNRGNALLALGQATDALAAARAALGRSDGAPHLRAFALLVAGDAHRRLGDVTAARESYRAALALGSERGDVHAQVSAYIALAESGLAPPPGLEVAALCSTDDDRDRWTLARGRLALVEGGPDLGELAMACAAVAVRASEADRLERAFRAHALAAKLALRGGDRAAAVAEADRARGAHAAILGATAPAFRAAVAGDPDLDGLPGPTPPSATRAPTAPDARELATARSEATAHVHLRRLLTLSRRLNSEPDVDRILDDVIDTAIELTAAERGFLLLRGASGELEPVVARNFAVAALSDPRAGASEPTPPTVSRSIAERAVQTGEPVVTVDAGVDERFGAAASVAAMRLRSVLVVPLRQRGQVIGCIYVDHRLRGGAFDEAATSLLGELADIAAIAIENARLATHLRRTTAEVDALAAKLSAELADRDAELVRVKAELPDRDRLRHRYDRIVGRSPSMIRMLDVLDRAAATALPVVIVGESGTGKELVARALHDHGARATGPFVAINCSAVPEQLLESELFGHVRGAFTGAERDRRGLFEVADGGTLFLDEIADTSPAMQAKLLRVLQDGQVRRVGDAKTHTVDVRVVAATQRPLAELVTAGTFREDLRFRLEVLAIAVPPLRDRDGDLPILVEALLARAAQGHAKPSRLTRAALRALAQHRWPGNIRELENALARGVAMGGEVIDLEDLPEAIAAIAAHPEPMKPTLGEDLRLRPALAATEQAYLAAAMDRAKQNQTVAARLLGLSRFGLQKKLRRLAGEPATATDADDAEP